MSKEAMKLALEALELEDMACRYEKEPTPEHIAKAITALREALEKPDFWEGYVPEPVKPAQQEPVAYIHRQGNHYEVSERFLSDDEKSRGWTEEPLYTSPPAQHHSKAWPPSHWTDYERSIAAAEREACAKVCEERLGPTATDFYGKTYAAAIRARSNT